MKNTNYNIRFIIGALLIGLTLVSCEEYLDKAPESTITDNIVFSKFNSFQGFLEEMYNCVTDYNKCGAPNATSYADEILNISGPTGQPWDDGNYWNQGQVFWGTTVNTNNETRTKRVWPLCWYGIRKANVCLSKLDMLVDGTQEERDLIKGQALFFRGWFYFELMRHWGGLPYVDRVLSSEEDLKLPRLNYRETALKAASDFEAAAALLPVDWDNTDAGKATLGNNRQRISKVFALAYLGKDLLYAASPMMNEESTGNNSFDAELCKRAAKAFADAINECNNSGMFKLQSWATWTDNFWVWSASRQKMSGGTEVIMNPIPVLTGRVPTQTTAIYVSKYLGGAGSTEMPANNYVKNYYMANGLPIDDPLSGYNPNDPWSNREPRFYSDMIVDGDELAATTAAGIDRYAQLYTGGRHRDNSITGYFYKRWAPKGLNKWQEWANFMTYIPYMRLADVYLMYAESVIQGYGTPQSSVPGSLTAEAAVNVIRNRAQLPNVDPRYTSSKEKFMEEIIQQRAVELAYEGHRWHDLRRWNIASEMKYRVKTAIDFDRGTNGKPINIKERVVVIKPFDKKHNWLPFQVSFTKLYKDFPQNPGW